MLNFLLTILCGSIIGAGIAETAGAYWHELVAHSRLFGRLLAWMLSGRHIHHHFVYHPNRPRSVSYQKSCELTYLPMGLAIIGALGLMYWFGILSPAASLSMVMGSILYGIGGLGYIHDLYHLDPAVVGQKWIFRRSPALYRCFLKGQAIHAIHHTYIKPTQGRRITYNNALVFVFLDMWAGTYLSPECVASASVIKPRSSLEFFPNTKIKTISSCKK